MDNKLDMMEISDKDKLLLKALLEVCIEDDVLDLDAYDSIERANKISDAWQALDVLKKITKPL